MDATSKKIRRRQTTLFVVVLFLLGVSLIFFSLAINPSVQFWSQEFWAGFVRDVGFLFAPTAVLTLLYENLAETKDTNEVSDDILDVIRHELEVRLPISKIHEDILTVYPGRHKINFYEYFGAANSKIDVLVTNLQTMQNDLPVLLERAKAGVNVRILAINPNHTFLANRFSEIRLRAGDQFKLEVVAALRQFCIAKETQLDARDQEKLSIRIYNNPPTIMLFRRDAHLILAFILRQGRAREQIHIEFACSKDAAGSRIADSFVTHFDTIWNEAEEVNYDKIEQMVVSKHE